ncbi:unnamed protein product [Penicillium nalgiovense]|uniref:Uncharacterized protein n=1 Tax=Penicillium nalgiovense TaxID=60175 RepID=A0A1V6WF38_PENNA|nr:hypothetical protein PENNAL_c0286G10909 [Penicillium nalgiovense]CAG8129998.1 unnamed protein product [Penicillium nalgiovense]CAG8150059.1 unnamed protein product [Penicillium nalgiovense]CAG8152487.1 unnamed protein product [Penicillium nalgiovense]CAG8155946.1 unnamed protein product [Penicillium nalgiovense]
MSSSNPEGVSKRGTRNQAPKEYNIRNLQRLAESGSGVSQPKAAAADAQASYIQPGSSKGTGAHTTNQSQSVQSQSKLPYNTQEEQPTPDGTGEMVPGEPSDQAMGDAESEREPSESPTASPRSGHMAENAAESGSPAPVGANDPSDSSDEVLTDLKKLSIGRDRDGEPDAWSRLGRSNVLLVRYGPYKAAKYRVQPGNGYSTQGLQKVSKLKTRISHVMYEGEDGEEHYRYSRDNIVGIVGVAVYERKDTDKVYKTAPPAFVKVKWQGIDAAHQKLLTRGNSWITKADLVRLTDLATAEQKISEAWDKQEERHIQWQGQIGRDSPDRSPTPCPLDSFKAQKEERIKRELTREPSMPSAQGMDMDPAGWRLGSRQPAVNNTQRLDSVSVKQELDDEDDEDNDLFVDGFSTNARNASGQNTSGQNTSGQNTSGQNTSGQDSNGPNNNGLNNDIRSGSGQNRPPPKLSKFYKRWLGRVGIPETDFNSLDDAYIARFEAAAYVYMDELTKQGYVVEDDMGVGA